MGQGAAEQVPSPVQNNTIDLLLYFVSNDSAYNSSVLPFGWMFGFSLFMFLFC
jgi:hypothetical protein